MIRAILMRLLGLKPIYEVRKINKASGRNIYGTKVYAGSSYQEAKDAFKKSADKLPDGYALRLQAVVILDMQIPTPLVFTKIDKINAGVNGAITVIDESSEVTETMLGKLQEPSDDFVKTRIEGTFPVNEAPRHECNYSGPMKCINGAYQPTCSTCGEPQS